MNTMNTPGNGLIADKERIGTLSEKEEEERTRM